MTINTGSVVYYLGAMCIGGYVGHQIGRNIAADASFEEAGKNVGKILKKTLLSIENNPPENAEEVASLANETAASIFEEGRKTGVRTVMGSLTGASIGCSIAFTVTDLTLYYLASKK